MTNWSECFYMSLGNEIIPWGFSGFSCLINFGTRDREPLKKRGGCWINWKYREVLLHKIGGNETCKVVLRCGNKVAREDWISPEKDMISFFVFVNNLLLSSSTKLFSLACQSTDLDFPDNPPFKHQSDSFLFSFLDQPVLETPVAE